MFSQFVQKLKNHSRFLFIFVVFFLLLVCLAVAFLVEPKYQASSQILIEETGATVQGSAWQSDWLDPQAVEAFAAFIESPEIMEQVRQELKIGISVSDLQKQIVVNHSDDSPVLTITVFSDSGQQSVKIANSLSSIFRNNVNRILDTTAVRIISQAEDVQKANGAIRNLVLGMIAATVVGFIFKMVSVYIRKSAKVTAETRKDARKKENQLQTVFK